MRNLLYAISLFFLSSTVAYAAAITEGGEKTTDEYSGYYYVSDICRINALYYLLGL